MKNFKSIEIAMEEGAGGHVSSERKVTKVRSIGKGHLHRKQAAMITQKRFTEGNGILYWNLY